MDYLQSDYLDLCSYQTSKKADHVSGDSYFVKMTSEYSLFAIADGLGSGSAAHESSSTVTNLIQRNHSMDVQTLMNMSNRALLNKRGSSVAIVKYYPHSKEFVYSCVGNVRFYLLTPAGKLIYPLPVYGYLSGKHQTYHTQRFVYEVGSVFLMHSDGMQLKNVRSLLSRPHDIKIIGEQLVSTYSPSTKDDLTFLLGKITK
ncbi:SpoIIE family protein phosphatase [Bacillus timonensis]|nr:SpoIIE family protein phosphatase [Bacillus timonensis]